MKKILKNLVIGLCVLLGLSSHGENKNICPILFGFHFNNPNYITKCTRSMEKQSKHENVIAIWDEQIINVQP
jgi:hypothetical protein